MVSSLVFPSFSGGKWVKERIPIIYEFSAITFACQAQEYVSNWSKAKGR